MTHSHLVRALPLVAGLIAFPAVAGESLTGTELALEGAYTVLHVLDYRQTRNIAAHEDRMEKNWFLGPHPSDRKVDRYFAATLVAHWAVTMALPRPQRTWWQGSTIAIEAVVVGRNKRLGLSVNF